MWGSPGRHLVFDVAHHVELLTWLRHQGRAAQAMIGPWGYNDPTHLAPAWFPTTCIVSSYMCIGRNFSSVCGGGGGVGMELFQMEF